MLDGAARIEDALGRGRAHGDAGDGMTDHGNMFGASEFWKAATGPASSRSSASRATTSPRLTLRPRAVLVGRSRPGSRRRRHGQRRSYTHLTMVAESTGPAQPVQALLAGHPRGPVRQVPAMDRDIVERHGRGIIATTGCPSGEVQTAAAARPVREGTPGRREVARDLRPGQLLLEVMDHGLSIERRRARPAAAGQDSESRRWPPTTATTSPADADHHEALLCVQTGKTLSDPNRFKFDGDGYYLKSAAEMRTLWAEHPEACDTTLLIAERCNVDVHRGAATGCRCSRCPRGRPRSPGCVNEVERGLARRFPGGVPQDRTRRGRLRDRRHLRDGVPRLLPGRRRPRQLRQRVGHPGRPGPWVGRRFAGRLRAGHHRHRPDRARTAVRAVPQPRAHLDARHRHRLRRPPPRRDGPLRHRAATARTGSPRSSPSAPSRPRPR